jgi:hypothetical protein
MRGTISAGGIGKEKPRTKHAGWLKAYGQSITAAKIEEYAGNSQLSTLWQHERMDIVAADCFFMIPVLVMR